MVLGCLVPCDNPHDNLTCVSIVRWPDSRLTVAGVAALWVCDSCLCMRPKKATHLSWPQQHSTAQRSTTAAVQQSCCPYIPRRQQSKGALQHMPYTHALYVLTYTMRYATYDWVLRCTTASATAGCRICYCPGYATPCAGIGGAAVAAADAVLL
jgi:hypothetical protein